MKKLSWKLFIVVLALVGMVASMPMWMTSQAEAQQQKVLKIGSLVPLNLKEGVEIQKWMNLFAKIYNEQGGWQIGNEKYKVEINIYDHAMDPAKMRSAAEKAVLQDGNKFLLNNWSDNQAQTVTITEPNKVLVLAGGFTPDLAKPNLQYYIRTSGVFFGSGSPYVIQRDYVARGGKTDIMVTSDTEMGHFGAKLWAAPAKLAGLNILPDVFFNPDTVDFGPIATKVKSYNPDVVELPFVSGDTVTNIISALKDVGFKGMVYPGNLVPYTLENAVKKVGKEYLEGMEVQVFDPRGIMKNPKILALYDRYTKEYGEFRTEGCWWVGGWFFFEDAVNATKSIDIDVLRNYLFNSKKGVATLEGYSQLFARPDLQNFRTIEVAPGHPVGMIKNGKLVPIKPVSVKDQYLVAVKCYNLVDIYQKYWDQYGYPKFPDEPSLFDFADLKK